MFFFETEEERIKDFEELAEENEVDIFPDFKEWLINEGFFRAPASTKYHGAYEGGLYDHCRCVFDRLANLTDDNKLVWHRKQSPFIIGMFHDLCKTDQYKWVDEYTTMSVSDYNDIVKGKKAPPGHYEYNTNTVLKGHGSKSVMLLSQFMRLTEEEVLCIRYHMGPYGNEEEQKVEWAGYDAAIRKTNGLCLWANTADMLASKVDGV